MKYFVLCFLLAVCLSAGLTACSPAGAATLPISGTATPTLTPGRTLEPTPAPTSTPFIAPAPTVTLIAIPSPTLAPTPLACWESGGRIESHQLEADWMRYSLDFRIYLPPCYDQQSERAYPVLYLFHGQTFTEDQWERLGAGETADRLIALGEVQPFLIVMPRDREGNLSNQDLLGRAFMELLVPWVDENYRTLPERSGRAVGGLSRGGGWAVHFGLWYWQDFVAIGAHSPALFWNDGPTITKLLDSIPLEEMPRIWIDMGAQDGPRTLESANWLESHLARRNIPHEWHLFAGYHDENYWRAHIEQYFRWYAEDW